MKLVHELNKLLEGTWELPQTVKQAKKLADLMKKPVRVDKAANKLSGLFGADDLFDMLIEMEDDGEGADDARHTIMSYLKDHMNTKKYTPRDPWDPKAVKILKSIKIK